MHVLRVFLVPLVFLGGLVFFASTLSGLLSPDTPCKLGACPETLYEGDSERVFQYTRSSVFKVRLDDRKNPPTALRCSPVGVIEAVSFNGETPYYTGTFRAMAPGACLLEGNVFSAMIVIK
ncbi:hypothetical protein COU18_00625 [Candidatus Kaiserbacteria bacterium CG10_big_fil_rev_8_21_14_0_10_51_14]|uniref:Uncharacterized protein n=1 Tax=Candidatus Kaiserbacteria bacterium CG10_big_fil_rev_8_21_14_0_10_51_14 TaxID=1974610 RepID=A0A2H0UC00_9BACT|nr:MAG: hypothetical protein COU18_00625 [Candidatus Kaiserbacteria bacterium CG10_big_fil_rev_8_21_14_0_10_51_14]